MEWRDPAQEVIEIQSKIHPQGVYSLSPLHLPQVQVPLGGIEMTDTRQVLRMEYTLIIAMRKNHDRMSWKMCSDIWLEKRREDDVS